MFDGRPVTGSVIDVIKGTIGTLKCTANSNPAASLFSWNINNVIGDTLTIDDNIQNGQIVSCTARNIMTSTAGLTMNGYGSISKNINLKCEYRYKTKNLYLIRALISLTLLVIAGRKL